MSTTICPEEIRAANHRADLEDIWASPEWITAVEAYLIEHPLCGCGKPAKTVHHIEQEDYKDKKRYVDFTRAKVVPICNRCHQELRKGRRICPKCKKHYIPIMDYCCKYCLPPAERLKQRAEQSAAKKSQKAWKEIRNKVQRKNAKAAYQAKKAYIKDKQQEDA